MHLKLDAHGKFSPLKPHFSFFFHFFYTSELVIIITALRSDMEIDSDISSTLFSRFFATGLGITASLSYVCHRFKQREHSATFEPVLRCVSVKMLHVCALVRNLPCFTCRATGCSPFHLVDCIIWARCR